MSHHFDCVINFEFYRVMSRKYKLQFTLDRTYRRTASNISLRREIIGQIVFPTFIPIVKAFKTKFYTVNIDEFGSPCCAVVSVSYGVMFHKITS